MKQLELYYPKPRDESFQPSCRTNRKSSGSVGEDTVHRIVKLYAGGQSVESITREVGRARHVVVHVLQSKGVFGNRPTEPDCRETRTGAPIVEELKEELVREVLKTESVDEPTSKSLRKPKSPRKSEANAETQPKPAEGEKTLLDSRLSPPVLGALCEVLGQNDLGSDMSLEEGPKLALRSKRRVRAQS